MALAKIYLSTHGYQSLIREITTPTLPTFVSSCLNLIVVKGTSQSRGAPAALIETIFESFSSLLPRHPTIFRPSLRQIKLVSAPYVAPTESDDSFVPSTLQESARRLVVLIHQTAPKNTSGEEWGGAIRGLLKLAQSTADQILRAVVEDWESSTGHVSDRIDAGKKCSGGNDTDIGLPLWTGVDAGAERLQGLLALLAEYFVLPTTGAVVVPLAHVEDLLSRLLSVTPPETSKGSSSSGSIRLHPEITKEEKNALWSALPRIHVAAMNVYRVMLKRLKGNHLPLAYDALEHLTWVFPSCPRSLEFRITAYHLLSQILPLVGLSLPKSWVASLNSLIHAVTADCLGQQFGSTQPVGDSAQRNLNGSSFNADSYLGGNSRLPSHSNKSHTELSKVAESLLPLLISYLPSHLLDGNTRAGLDKAAVLVGDKDALLASILYPHVASNGKVLTSLLPHLVRQFGEDSTTETLLHPRFPMVSQATTSVYSASALGDDTHDLPDDSEMLDVPIADASHVDLFALPSTNIEKPTDTPDNAAVQAADNIWNLRSAEALSSTPSRAFSPTEILPPQKETNGTEGIDDVLKVRHIPQSVGIGEEEEDSDDESVHMVAEMETDSEDE